MTFVAKRDLFLPGDVHRAHAAGDVVPDDHIDTYGWRDAVQQAGTPEQVSQVVTDVTADDSFDPADHSVEKVNDYLRSSSPEERQRVLTLEAQGKNRSKIGVGG